MGLRFMNHYITDSSFGYKIVIHLAQSLKEGKDSDEIVKLKYSISASSYVLRHIFRIHFILQVPILSSHNFVISPSHFVCHRIIHRCFKVHYSSRSTT